MAGILNLLLLLPVELTNFLFRIAGQVLIIKVVWKGGRRRNVEIDEFFALDRLRGRGNVILSSRLEIVKHGTNVFFHASCLPYTSRIRWGRTRNLWIYKRI